MKERTLKSSGVNFIYTNYQTNHFTDSIVHIRQKIKIVLPLLMVILLNGYSIASKVPIVGRFIDFVTEHIGPEAKIF